jgi:hypothetical protein
MRLSARLVAATAVVGLLAGVPVAANAAARTKPGAVQVAQLSAAASGPSGVPAKGSYLYDADTAMLRMRSLPAGQATD